MATKKKRPQWALWRNRPKWAKALTAQEWRHLCDDAFDHGTRPTLDGVKRNRAGQAKDGSDCWDCHFIAKKLGLGG